jgi:hypothetical protein
MSATPSMAIEECDKALVASQCLTLYASLRGAEDGSGRLLYPIFFKLPTKAELPEYYRLIREVRGMMVAGQRETLPRPC